MSPGTLENRRVKGTGPRYIKLHKGQSGRVVYRMEDILRYEAEHTVRVK